MFLILLIIAFSIIGTIAQDPTLTISAETLPTVIDNIAAAYDGQDTIYLLGGYNSSQRVSDILKFTISTERIEKIGQLPEAIFAATAIWDGTGVVYFGGEVASGAVNSIRRYVPGKSITHAAGNLPTANSYSVLVATTNYGDALIFGGSINGNRIVRFSNNLATEITNSRLPMEINRASAFHYLSENEESVYLFGGYNEEILDSIVMYNIENGKSSVLPQSLPYSIRFSSSFYDGNYAYIVGGQSSQGEVLNVIQFNPRTKEVALLNVTNFPNQLSLAPVVYVEKLKKAYIFGGKDASGYRNQIMYLTF